MSDIDKKGIKAFENKITKKTKNQVIDEPLLDFFIDLVESIRSYHKWDAYQNKYMVELFLRIKKAKIREKKL